MHTRTQRKVVTAGMLAFVAGSIAASLSPTAHADVVLDWNQELLSAISATNAAPPRAARAMAMTHVAMYEAVNSIGREAVPYQQYFNCPADTNKQAAAAVAAHGVLSSLFPSRQSFFDSRLSTTLSAIADSPQKAEGINLGNAASSWMLTLRSTDNSTLSVPYTNGTTPGAFRTVPTSAAPVLPQWRHVTPFSVQSASQFRPGPAPALGSAEYTAAYNQVKELGSATSSTRTQYQTDTAYLWRAGGNTVTPPGQWQQVAQQVAVTRGQSMEENARMFALLGMAVSDAAITSWETKYADMFWRPETGIQQGDMDGNPDTVGDVNWLPLLTTPNHPSYTSGHSTFSSASAAVLRNWVGSDSFTFTVTGDGRSREYASFTDAMHEAGMSRIYGGIHWAFDNTAGLSSGTQIGDWVFANALPVPTPGVLALAGLGGLMASRRRR